MRLSPKRVGGERVVRKTGSSLEATLAGNLREEMLRRAAAVIAARH